MKKYILKKRIFAIVFIVVVFGFAGINFVHSYEPIRECLTKEDVSVTALDTTITESLYGRMNFIETYAYVQTLLDKRESNNFSYIKDEDGFLHYASFYRDEDTRIFEYAMRVKRLQDSVESKGTKVLFVVPPSKYNEEYTQFRTGMPVNDAGHIVDELMFYLNRLGVETLNLGESIPGEEISYEDAFFKTDHHWTIPAAFYATKEVVNKIENSFGEDLDPEDYYLDISNYDVVTYEGGMLGSMGRKTGVHFCEMEDFTALWPHFTGNYSREYMMENGIRIFDEGEYVEVAMDSDLLLDEEDIYSHSQYSLYLNGLTVYDRIINEDNPDGCSIFMIRDSYFSPVMAFMMPMCGQIDAIWSLEDTEEIDIEKHLEENTFDYIIIEVYPYNINSSAFNYFKDGA